MWNDFNQSSEFIAEVRRKELLRQAEKIRRNREQRKQQQNDND